MKSCIKPYRKQGDQFVKGDESSTVIPQTYQQCLKCDDDKDFV